MALYPNTLFHFTTKEGFLGILENNFRLSYALEKIRGPHTEKVIAIPMVSFCDLRLSELSRHIQSYGRYGIGLSKDWAERQKLNPVFYVNPDAQVVGDAMWAIDKLNQAGLAKGREGEASEQLKLQGSVMNILRFMKNYEGDLVREGKVKEQRFRFANEREWRFVPDVFHAEVLPFVRVTGDGTWNSEIKAKCNKLVAHLPLKFDPDDIKYLVVEQDEERLPLLPYLSAVTGKNYSEDEIKRLSTRILTSEQIETDM